MKTVPHKTERLHSLDSLRAIMMLLGIVLHTVITYQVADTWSGWPFKDLNATSLSNDFIYYFIHSFRMQIFFVVSGFFGAMLFYEREPRAMIKNRLSRIVYPFLVFIVLLWPIVAFVWTYTGFVLGGSANVMTETMAIVGTPLIIIPQNTFHLWFLYYLALTLGLTILLAFALKKTPKFTQGITKTFNWIIQKPLLRVFFFASLTVLVFLLMGESKVATPGSWIPEFPTFIYYFFFLIVGWVLFKSKNLLDQFKRMDWISLGLGLLVYMAYFFNRSTISFELQLLANSVMVWFFIFGFTGLFLRYGSGHSPLMRYISDASYWVYLIHLPIVGFIPSLIVNWDLPSTIKVLIVITGTSVICFGTYHLFVRSTFIGKFLNGRKYSRKLSDIQKQEELSRPKVALG
jgi:glucan biosynthesis protein C